MGVGGLVSGRGGQPGFDQLINEEFSFEAGMTLGDTVRLTAVATPVTLDAGAPTSNSTLQLGTLADPDSSLRGSLLRRSFGA